MFFAEISMRHQITKKSIAFLREFHFDCSLGEGREKKKKLQFSNRVKSKFPSPRPFGFMLIVAFVGYDLN